MSIKADDTLGQRAVQLRQNYAKTFTATTTGTAVDLIRNNNQVFWYPYWGAFYWVANGRLILKIDNSYSTSDADIADPSLDPCQSTQPIFGCTGLSDSDCIKHVTYAMNSDFGYGNDATFIDHVWVFKFMYFVVNGGGVQNVVYKL
jgi:hypothetical protein